MFSWTNLEIFRGPVGNDKLVSPISRKSKSAKSRKRPLEMISLETRQVLSTFTVTSAADSGAGSLRQAIIDADKGTGASTINFSIGSGQQTINLNSALPSITVPLTINGTSQPGYAGTPLITLNGSSAGSGVQGLDLAGGNDVVLGLAIDSFSANAIQLDGNNNTIAGNYLGVDATGTKAAGNGGCGVKVNWSSSGNTIGGTTALTRNVISANGSADPYGCRGVLLNGSNNNTVEGNYFGTNAAGTASLSNYGDDICLVSAAHNTIGGTAPGAGNLISGSGRVGIWLNGWGTSNNTIQGNIVGLDVTGSKPLGNQITGIMSAGAQSNLIGGTTPSARNVISGNVQGGIVLQSGSWNFTIQGNYIGTNSAGTKAIGNVGHGVEVDPYVNNVTIANNLISGNSLSGIDLMNSQNDVITGNIIGTDATGNKAIPNGHDGITVEKGSNHITIGGTAAGASNLISGNNWDGILVNGVSSTGTGVVTIQGTEIGTSLDGTKSIMNCGDGVQVDWGATNVVIGGAPAGSGNLISGNARDGVHIFRSTGNTVQGNLIGTDVSGKLALGNHLNGVYLGSGGNTIGGTAAGTGNVIAANGTNGVWVNGQSKITISGIVYDTDGKTGGNVFQGNSIGVNASGAILSNGNDGMYLLQPGQIQIGGTAAGARNIIAGKTANGTYADGSTNTGTSMSDTGGWSIEVVGAPNLTLTNNTLLTVTASVDTTAHTITVGSQKGNTVYTLIN